MKLLVRIVSFVLIGIIALLTVDGYLAVRREIRLFDSDMARDGLLLARTLKPLVADTWRTKGEDAALEFVNDVGRQMQHIRICWVWLDTAACAGEISSNRSTTSTSGPSKTIHALFRTSTRAIPYPCWCAGGQYTFFVAVQAS